MSWPDDGEPRFIVTSIGGWVINSRSAGRSGSHKPGLAFQVLDRAYAHAVVREFQPGREKGFRREESRRSKALELAAALNAEDSLPGERP